ncbi:MAG: TIR domain-containing protein, partial [Acidobacteriota bacterium]
MAGVFISYRRGDTAGFSGRLCDSLRDVFGPERVFMDVAGSIEPGADFHQVLESAVAAADVFVVMIGPEWLEVTGQDGRRRLEDPEDWVRSEVATALERQVRVVPVLVDGATMPQKDELPDSLKTLAKRNAIELRAARWDSDVEELVKVLRKDLGEEKAALPWLKWAVAGGVLVLAGLLAWHFWPRVTEPQEVEIPPLTGLSFEQAQAELGQLALRARR